MEIIGNHLRFLSCQFGIKGAPQSDVLGIYGGSVVHSTVQRFCNCEDGYSQPGFFYHVFLNEIHAFSAIVAGEGKAFDKSP